LLSNVKYFCGWFLPYKWIIAGYKTDEKGITYKKDKVKITELLLNFTILIHRYEREI